MNVHCSETCSESTIITASANTLPSLDLIQDVKTIRRYKYMSSLYKKAPLRRSEETIFTSTDGGYLSVTPLIFPPRCLACRGVPIMLA